MLIHPWDSAVNDYEWQEWLSHAEKFGVLMVNNVDVDLAPIAVPTHFTLKSDQILMHLARPNPVWQHIEAASQIRLVVIGDYAYIPNYWRAKDGDPTELGVPTSYYATVQFICQPEIVDDPQGKVDILNEQFADVQPEGGHATVDVNSAPYGPMLPGIRGLKLHIISADAKFKYDDAKPEEFRERVSEELHARNRRLDPGVARQQKRRLGLIGLWRNN
ncbi:MAG: FMN-binding negative transcriptional regulator [Actinobacteria bacterium]|uniref:Unannotated protein n=1 Tax=freshwater metagenome TaxID=449393 RepID=A0A6J5YI36_9ZZZZ|nr:FMN-binding negative transcriptional regulator [Actinomycetota bacterium]